MWNADDFFIAKNYVYDVLDKSAAERNIYLKPEAKDVVVREMIRRAINKQISANDIKIVLPEEEVSELYDKVVVKSSKEDVSPKIVESILVGKKTAIAKTTIPSQIIQNVEISGVDLGKGMDQVLKDDLLLRAFRLAESGLTVDEINIKIDSSLKMLFRVGPKLNKTIYKAIFSPIVNLTITSTPDGASVELKGSHIGKTTINRKPLDAGDYYTFNFKLDGYKPSNHLFYVECYPDNQTLDEVLIKE